MDAVQEAIENTYTKEEVDGLVSGVFHFKGEAESVEALPAASAEAERGTEVCLRFRT